MHLGPFSDFLGLSSRFRKPGCMLIQNGPPKERSTSGTEPRRSRFFPRGKGYETQSPKQVTFWVAVVVAVIGIFGSLVTIPVLSGFAFWLVVIAFIILVLGNLIDGM